MAQRPVFEKTSTIWGSVILVCFMFVAGCDTGANDGSQDIDIEVNPEDPPLASGDWYQPAVGVTWQWQLSGTVNTIYDVDIYDIDLFDSSAALIANLQAEGRRVICYFSAGSYEEWRSDADLFQEADLGNPLDNWPGERWLDIRSDSVRVLMQRRLDLAASKGCDAVEPDNVDGFTNRPGFQLTESDQMDYNAFLANEAHLRGLAIGLKNALEQVAALEPYFDFAVNEQCFEYEECDLLAPFIDNDKPVLNAEYRQQYVNDAGRRRALCTDAVSRHFSTLVLPLELDDTFRYSCGE